MIKCPYCKTLQLGLICHMCGHSLVGGNKMDRIEVGRLDKNSISSEKIRNTGLHGDHEKIEAPRLHPNYEDD